MPRIVYPPSRPGPPEHQASPRFLTLLSRVLLVLALTLVLVIAAGTVYALAFRPKSASLPPGASGSGSGSALPVSGNAAIFTNLGRLRCPTAPPSQATVILQAAFPYNPGDRPFSEELVSRIRDFRSLTLAYFAALSPGELRAKGEEEVKAELLAAYNDLLRLGRITTLYFNEFMLIE
jgi:flagellar basal body-associated protein FliL